MVQIGITTAVATYYGFESRTTFSTEGSFGKGLWEGPYVSETPESRTVSNATLGDATLVF